MRILLDEHVGRIFERVLQARGHKVDQAKDVFGEQTSDAELIEWCAENSVLFISNNAKDFSRLHRQHTHSGILLYFDQNLPDNDPEGLARTVDEVLNQYGDGEIENSLVDLGEWYEWVHY